MCGNVLSASSKSMEQGDSSKSSKSLLSANPLVEYRDERLLITVLEECSNLGDPEEAVEGIREFKFVLKKRVEPYRARIAKFFVNDSKSDRSIPVWWYVVEQDKNKDGEPQRKGAVTHLWKVWQRSGAVMITKIKS